MIMDFKRIYDYEIAFIKWEKKNITSFGKKWGKLGKKKTHPPYQTKKKTCINGHIFFY